MKKIIIFGLLFTIINFLAFLPLPIQAQGETTEDKGYVIRMEKSTIYVDLGEPDGIKEGTILEVYKVGPTITHPVTGKEIKIPGAIIGELKVIKVYAEASEAEPLDPQILAKIELKDRVRIKKIAEAPSLPEEKPKTGSLRITYKGPIYGQLINVFVDNKLKSAKSVYGDVATITVDNLSPGTHSIYISPAMEDRTSLTPIKKKVEIKPGELTTIEVSF